MNVEPPIEQPVDTAEQPQEGYAAEPQQDPNAGTEASEGETEQPGDGEQRLEHELEPIAAPTSWAKDAKEVFGTLPREAQEVIAQREADREKFLQQKSRESSSTRQAVESEARQALSTIMENHQRALEQFLPPVPQMPDPRLLSSQDPQHRDLYYQQKAEYDYAAAQRDAISQQIEQSRQHADAISQQQYQAEIQAEHHALEDALGTEWSDPSERAKLLEQLQPIAAELGYSQEVMAQARAADILALRQIGNWRTDAEKYRSLMKKKMEPVRAAKTALPPAARPGTAGGNASPADAASLLYPDDIRR